MLGCIGLEILIAAADRGLEDGDAAGGVVEGVDLVRVEADKELLVKVEVTRLGVRSEVGVAADGLGEGLVGGAVGEADISGGLRAGASGEGAKLDNAFSV